MGAIGNGGVPAIRGVGVDGRGRCSHWGSPTDIVSIRLPCCSGFWACHACHEELADHPAERWSLKDFDAEAVLCGACARPLTITAYLSSPRRCSLCGADFNPGCVRHHPLYFEVPGPGGRSDP